MRRGGVIIAIMLLAAGCAGTKLGMLDGEKSCTDDGGQTYRQCDTGAVAVIDEDGEDIALIDQSNSRTNVGSRRPRAKGVDPAKIDKRYGALFAGMPAPPRTFILYFKNNSTELTEESLALIPRLFSEVERRPGVDVQIVGHTDSPGEVSYNADLSIKRATEVASMLVDRGLDQRLVRATGRGEYEPFEGSYRDNSPEPRNKRVEVIVK